MQAYDDLCTDDDLELQPWLADDADARIRIDNRGGTGVMGRMQLRIDTSGAITSLKETGCGR